MVRPTDELTRHTVEDLDLPPGPSRAAPLKARLARPIYRSGLHRWCFRRVATVVAFHRVDDALANDAISCSEERFRRFCAFFSRYFNVVPVTEILRRVRAGQPLDGRLAITFDDGYRDNYEIAAPILREYGLPATFFISTDFIDSPAVPYWDEELAIQTEWMTWDQIRDLASMGFDIGAHTLGHENLATLEGDRLLAEIRGSKDRLESELGEPVPLFSYPFGDQEHMSEAARQLVREIGFDCCFSAYGGLVRTGQDPFHLPRIPISHWYADEWQFAFEAIFQRGA